MDTAPDADPTWRYPWPAGTRLAGDVALLTEFRGRRCCELGCGRGAVGRAALAAGAAEVLFLDISPEPLALLADELGHDPRVRTARHAWGDPVPDGPYDLVLGGDILYRPPYFRRLIHSVGLALDGGSTALLADPRTTLEPELFDAIAAEGLTATQERREAGYTLLRLRRG